MSEEKDLTVKAKAETPCACACAENLSEYVLSVDFVNALQNIRNMINNAITNVDLKAILNKLIIEINARLQNVWKHFMEENGGIIEEDNITLAKQKLQTIEKKVGRTIVLSYIKAKTGEDGQPISKRYNDLYVCLPTIRPANATINEALETNETHPLAWIKIISDEFIPGDDPDDVDLDDILRKLEEFEKRLNEIIDIIRSIWAYLCKNWWEFVDAVENQTDENKIRENPNIAQNYYDRRDKNIYVFLKTAKATTDIGEPTEAAWIPLLNAENLPFYQNAWRHTSVVSAVPTTAPTGNENFVGNTKYCTADKNVYVWLPTTVGEGGKKWVALITGDQNAWRHTEVLASPPTTNGQFIGQTVYSTTEENIQDNPKGDVFVWLPTVRGKPGGSPYQWFNITRTKEINSISNYVPETLTYHIQANEIIQPNIKYGLTHKRTAGVTNTIITDDHGKPDAYGNYVDSIYRIKAIIERAGLMVNFYFSFDISSEVYPTIVNKTTMGAVSWAAHNVGDNYKDVVNFARATLPTAIFINKCKLYRNDSALDYFDNILRITDLHIKYPGTNTLMTDVDKIKWFAPSVSQVQSITGAHIKGVNSTTNVQWADFMHSAANFPTSSDTDYDKTKCWSDPVNIKGSDNPFYNNIKKRIADDGYSMNYVKPATHRPAKSTTLSTDWSEGKYFGTYSGGLHVAMGPDGLFRITGTVNGASDDDDYWVRRCVGFSISMSWPGRAVQ